MRKGCNSKLSNLTFKQMLEAQSNQDNIYQLYSNEIQSIKLPSRIEYTKYQAKEYCKFLLDPSLIIGHLVKVSISLALLTYLSQDYVMTDLPKVKHMLESFLLLGIGFIIVMSATRSMLIPLAGIILSATSNIVPKDFSFLAQIDPIIMQYLLATGICGIGIAVFCKPSIRN